MSKLSDIKKEDLKELTTDQLIDLKMEAHELLAEIDAMILECRENFKK